MEMEPSIEVQEKDYRTKRDKNYSRFRADLSDKYILLQIGLVLEDLLQEVETLRKIISLEK